MIGWWSESSVPEERGRDRSRPPPRTEIGGGGTRVKASVLGRQETDRQPGQRCAALSRCWQGLLRWTANNHNRADSPMMDENRLNYNKVLFFPEETPHHTGAADGGRASWVRGTLPAPCPFQVTLGAKRKGHKKGPSGAGGAKQDLRERRCGDFSRGRRKTSACPWRSSPLPNSGVPGSSALADDVGLESIWFLGFGDQQTEDSLPPLADGKSHSGAEYVPKSGKPTGL